MVAREDSHGSSEGAENRRDQSSPMQEGRVRRIFKPSPGRIALTLLMPLIVGTILTLSLEAGLAFYQLMLTPTFEMYADELYAIFNYFVLLWIPFYLLSCLIIWLLSSARK